MYASICFCILASRTLPLVPYITVSLPSTRSSATGSYLLSLFIYYEFHLYIGATVFAFSHTYFFSTLNKALDASVLVDVLTRIIQS
jgi:hypothetical protein